MAWVSSQKMRLAWLLWLKELRVLLTAIQCLRLRLDCGADVRLFWHPQGDYLAVQVDRFTKTRKSTFTAFELFSVKEKDIPMEVLAPCTRPLHRHNKPHTWCSRMGL